MDREPALEPGCPLLGIFSTDPVVEGESDLLLHGPHADDRQVRVDSRQGAGSSGSSAPGGTPVTSVIPPMKCDASSTLFMMLSL